MKIIDSLENILAHFVFSSAKTQNSQTEPGAKRANLSDHQLGNLSEKLPWSEKKMKYNGTYYYL